MQAQSETALSARQVHEMYDHLIIDEYHLDKLIANKENIHDKVEFFNHLRQIFKSTWICLNRGYIDGSLVSLNLDEYAAEIQSWFPEFYLPTLRYPLRGGAKIVQYAKEVNNVFLDLLQDKVQLPKIHMANVEVPHNLISSFDPKIFDYEKFGEMVKQQDFFEIFSAFEHNVNYLIVIEPYLLKNNTFGIDGNDDIEAIRKKFAERFGREELPLIWTSKIKSPEQDVRAWVKGNKNCDLITEPPLAAGFESEFVVVFWNHQSLSAISRATTTLIVVEVNMGLMDIEQDKMVIVDWDKKEAFLFHDWKSERNLVRRRHLEDLGEVFRRLPSQPKISQRDASLDIPDDLVEIIKEGMENEITERKLVPI